jgi:hypothetical protein
MFLKAKMMRKQAALEHIDPLRYSITQGVLGKKCRTPEWRGLRDVPYFRNPPKSPFTKGGLRGIVARGLMQT